MPYCHNCGHEVRPQEKFCTECGAKLLRSIPAQHASSPTPVQSAPVYAPVQSAPAPRKSRLGMLFSSIGFPLSALLLLSLPLLSRLFVSGYDVFLWLFALLAVCAFVLNILGIVFQARAKRRTALAVWGLILSVFACFLAVLLVGGSGFPAYHEAPYRFELPSEFLDL